jgi:hypothetical protein
MSRCEIFENKFLLRVGVLRNIAGAAAPKSIRAIQSVEHPCYIFTQMKFYSCNALHRKPLQRGEFLCDTYLMRHVIFAAFISFQPAAGARLQ